MTAGFASPAVLALLVAVPLAAVAWWWGARASRRAMLELSRTRAGGPRALAAVLLLTAATAAVVAAAAPRWGERTTQSPRRGADVIVVIDVSRSMGARDVLPSRLEAAKSALVATLGRLSGERVGVVVFGGDARLRFPLTSDLHAAALVVRGLEPGMGLVDPGTATASGLDIALASFDEERSTGRLILLVADGDDLGSDPAGAARRIRDAGVTFLVFGAGTSEGGTVPVYDARTKTFVDKVGADGTTIVSALDSTFLAALASAAGGTYLGSDFSALPAAVTGRVAALERAEMASRSLDIPIERFQWFAAAALGAVVMLTIGEWLRPRVGRLAGAAAVLGGALALSACASEAYDLNEAGRTALADGDVGTAVERFYAAEAARPGDVDIILNLSGALIRAERFEEATRAARRVLLAGGDEDRVRGFDLLGHARFGAGDLEGALDAFRQALLLDPGYERSRHDYEVVLRLMRAPEEGGDDGDAGGQPGDSGDQGGGAGPTPSASPGASPPPGGDGTPGPGGGDPGDPASPGSMEALADRLRAIDREIAALLADGEAPTAEEAVKILDLLAERSRVVALRDAFLGDTDPRDY